MNIILIIQQWFTHEIEIWRKVRFFSQWPRSRGNFQRFARNLSHNRKWRLAGPFSLELSNKSRYISEGKNPPSEHLHRGILTLRLSGRDYRSFASSFWDHLSTIIRGQDCERELHRERDPCTSTKNPPSHLPFSLDSEKPLRRTFAGQSSFSAFTIN